MLLSHIRDYAWLVRRGRGNRCSVAPALLVLVPCLPPQLAWLCRVEPVLTSFRQGTSRSPSRDQTDSARKCSVFSGCSRTESKLKARSPNWTRRGIHVRMKCAAGYEAAPSRIMSLTSSALLCASVRPSVAEHPRRTRDSVRSASRAWRPARGGRARLVALCLVDPGPSRYNNHGQSLDGSRNRSVWPEHASVSSDAVRADGDRLGHVHNRTASRSARRARFRLCVPLPRVRPVMVKPDVLISSCPHREWAARLPLSSRQDRHGHALSAPESPRMESSAVPSPPNSRPRSLAGPSAAITSAFTSLSSSWPRLGVSHSPQSARQRTSTSTSTHRTKSDERSSSPPSERMAAGWRHGVRRSSAGMSLVHRHFADIGGWGADTEPAATAYEIATVVGHDTKPKRPKCDTAPSHRDPSVLEVTVATTASHRAPVSAIERIDYHDFFRRAQTQTDCRPPGIARGLVSIPRRVLTAAEACAVRALAATRPRPGHPLGPAPASFPLAPPLSALAGSRSSSSSRAATTYLRKSSMGVLQTGIPRPEHLRLTSLERRPLPPPGTATVLVPATAREPSYLG